MASPSEGLAVPERVEAELTALGKSLAAAEQAEDEEAIRFLRAKDLLLREEKNILLRAQTGLGSSSEDRQQMNEIFEFVQQQKEQNQTISISGVDASAFKEMQQKAGLTFRPCEDLQFAASTNNVDAFAWDEPMERAQSDCYMPYLRSIIKVPRTSSWVDAARFRQLLNCDATKSLGKKFKGNTDVAVSSRQCVIIDMPETGLQLMLELKKGSFSKHDGYQAMAALLIGNLLSPSQRPIMVLTYLVNGWRMFWIDGSTLCFHVFEERNTAVSFLETFLAASDPSGESCELNKSCKQVAQRREFSGSLVQPGSSTLCLPEGAEDVLSLGELQHLKAQHLINLLDDSPSAYRVPYHRQPCSHEC